MTERNDLPSTVNNGGLGAPKAMPLVPAVYSTVAWWLATVAWAVLIFHLSTPTYSTTHSITLLARLLVFFEVSVSPTTLAVLNSLIRTVAHLTVYAIFALLLYRSCHGQKRFGWNPSLAVLSVSIAALYSVTDEYHQSFTSTRGASVVDCFLDTTGAASGILFAYFSIRFSSWRTGTKSGQRSAVSFQAVHSTRDEKPGEPIFDGLRSGPVARPPLQMTDGCFGRELDGPGHPKLTADT